MNAASVRARFGALSILLGAIGVSSCGGGGSSSSPLPAPSGTPPAAILVAGATYQYAGTQSVAITYASPSATSVNSNGAYSYVANQTVSASATGASAPFDVHRVTTYTVTAAPLSGELLLATTADTYENQTFSGATETVTTAGSSSLTTGTDLNAGLRLGTGPFNESSTATTAYTVAATDSVYPLQTGASSTQLLARTVNTVTTDASAGGTYGGGGTTSVTYNNDGSYARTFAAGDGSSQQQDTINANGTAQLATQTATRSTTDSIGLPTGGAGAMTIPVSVTSNGIVTNDSAVDWYPGAGQPVLPLSLTTRTVVGPAALPSFCAFSGSAPPVIQETLTTTDLNPMGSYASSSEQLYNANGITICRTQTSTSNNYDITTGVQTSTTTTIVTESLVASNQTITGVKRSLR